MEQTKRFRPTRGFPEPGEEHEGTSQCKQPDNTAARAPRSSSKTERQVMGCTLPHIEHRRSPGNAVGNESPLWDLFSKFLKYTVSGAATLAA